MLSLVVLKYQKLKIPFIFPWDSLSENIEERDKELIRVFSA